MEELWDRGRGAGPSGLLRLGDPFSFHLTITCIVQGGKLGRRRRRARSLSPDEEDGRQEEGWCVASTASCTSIDHLTLEELNLMHVRKGAVVHV